MVGVDEETALVHGLGTPEGTWQVHGGGRLDPERNGRTKLADAESVQLARRSRASSPTERVQAEPPGRRRRVGGCPARDLRPDSQNTLDGAGHA